MITEDYVSFETAKLLKEKGFDGPCYKVWESHGGSQTLVGAPWFVEGETVVNRESVDAAAKQYVYEYSLINNNVEGYLAPTLQMAMKWLRTNFNVNPVPYSMSLGWAFDIFDLSDRDITGSKKLFSMDFPKKSDCFNSYEEAAESAIKYCLENLI